ncbi:hypothetical protein [Roseibacillus ishigakijimensis]|uniref:Uncharacterized protein n=1 Tax=Roseibacillus ishigakijimensis TaxID=454146 RepID=A0A934RNE5_9BACT|nr:hypothetical protein [Roseibacillus ishigakijimensis]MBK1833995.1 hypothetical protein [Roseibacillus ishigakijimensis]
MNDSDELVCKPTQWFIWRAAAMAVMFAVGAFMFFKDWKWGYPEKNVQRFYYLAFEQAKEDFAEHEQLGKSAAEWEAYASAQKVFQPIDKNGEKVEKVAPVVPAETDLATTWPEILADYETYQPLYEAGKNIAAPPGWKKFTNSGGRAWEDKAPDELKSERKIKEQLYIGILCTILLLVAIFFLLRTLGRTMRVTGEGYIPPGGKLIPFSAIKRIDARKWDTKGLATLYYERDGKEQKSKVDGMVYGQFKKEEGEPAQRLYERILENFDGELIELAPDEEDEETRPEGKQEATNDSED